MSVGGAHRAPGHVVSIWAPTSLTVLLRKPAKELPFPLGEPACRLYTRARHGLWHGALALGLAPGDEVLVPAYHHGSEVEALVRAGLTPRFYEATESLEPDEAELDELAGPRTRAVHLTHVMGLPRDARRWREWCDQRDLFLVEDAAQAWLAERDGRPVGSVGHLGVFCLYKTVGLPTGSASVSTRPPPEPPAQTRMGAVPLARSLAGQFVRRRARLAPMMRRRARPYDPAEDFALGDTSTPLSAGLRHLVARIPYAMAAARRRENYRALQGALAELVPPPFRTLEAGASPFVFPVEAREPEGLLARLRAVNVEGVNFWSVPHPSLPAERFPAAARLRGGVVGLPVHQGVSALDLERMADVVRAHRGEPHL